MKLQQYISSLRKFRVWHKYLGLSIAFFLFLSSITGILLALKKEVDILQPPTQKGESKELSNWKPISELADLAQKAFIEAYPVQSENPIDRLDIRPSKGIAKVLFENGFWEVQIDGTSGEVKSIAQRHSDWIEHLHDGSIIGDWFKLFSMNYLGLGALILITTGFWLWYGPKKVRKIKHR
ncbi:PepSY domain-containing protein [Saprospiraceae bacterium]|nr:PepSY domain-containing protein [Bacteroidota bacterium]MDB4727236.1 PepSY domain-containing protein [Saprospiraceae bacterium]